MAVNYDDERFNQITQEQNNALQNVQNTYNNMINQSQQFYDAQARAAEDYGRQQQELQQANTDFTIQQIEQQKERATQDYTKEQKGAYVDYQKASNQYGVNAEQLASRGLRNGGYSESSQVSMYNQYQNRVGQARESYNRAIQDYDSGITEARLTNNAKLAEIAYKALQTKLETNLAGFQYNNQLLLNQMNEMQNINDKYYSRWKDVLNQINYENEQAENQRRYEEQMAAQRTAQATSRISSGGSSGGSGGNYAINKNGTGEDYEIYTNSNGQLASENIKKVNGVSYIPQIDKNTGLQNGVTIDGVDYPLYASNGVLYIFKNGKPIEYTKIAPQSNTGSLWQQISKIANKVKNTVKNTKTTKTQTPFEQLQSMAKSASKKK
jgi:hypothetical protein